MYWQQRWTADLVAYSRISFDSGFLEASLNQIAPIRISQSNKVSVEIYAIQLSGLRVGGVCGFSYAIYGHGLLLLLLLYFKG